MEHRLPPPNFSFAPKIVAKVSAEKKQLAACGLFGATNSSGRSSFSPNPSLPVPPPSPVSAKPANEFIPRKRFKQQECRQFQKRTKFCDKPKTTESFFCDACEMDFQCNEELKAHCFQHTECPVEGCKKRYHPNVMDRHVETLHASNVFEKVRKLSTPEEIAAWREERKKKFPTLENIQKRKDAMEQKQKRGERLSENRAKFGRKMDRDRANVESRPRKGKNKRKANLNKSNKPPMAGKNPRDTPMMPKSIDRKVPVMQKEDKNQDEIPDSCCGILRFKGTSQLPDYKHMNSKSAEKPNALLSLIGAYGSEDESEASEEDDTEHVEEKRPKTQEMSPSLRKEEYNSISRNSKLNETAKENLSNSSDDGPSEQSSQRVPLNMKVDKKSLDEEQKTMDLEEKQSDSSDEGPLEQPIEKFAIEPEKKPNDDEPTTSGKSDEINSASNAQKIQRIRRSGLDYRKVARLRKQNTMLEKLLETEIRHERNVLFQCVRFVCENGFFGIGKAEDPKSNK